MPDLPHELTRLYARIPIGMRLGLDAMRSACRSVGSPEASFPIVHVAGTNGKGSVCAMTAAIAKEHGLKTGLYTSPHLCRFAERIRIDGEPIDDAALAEFLARALDAQPELSFFEAATLAAFLAFRDARVDVAVVEVGIGGRLDATNVVPRPVAAAITRIALDHTDRLGSTLVAIAREKAGIAKAGASIALGPMAPDVRAAIDEVAHALGATTFAVDDVVAPTVIGLAGEHQRDNARVAAALATKLGASRTSVERGIAAVRWPGRLERVGGFLLDAAHNPDGADALARHLRALGHPPRDVALVFGTLGDKDWAPMLDVLGPLAETRVYVAPHGASRAPSDPRDMATRHPGTVTVDTRTALEISTGGAWPNRDSGRLVVVAGSLVLIGEARALLLGLPRDPPVSL